MNRKMQWSSNALLCPMNLSERNRLLFHAAVLLLTLSPLLLVTYVPIIDLPNHIGRAFILSNISHLAPLQQFRQRKRGW